MVKPKQKSVAYMTPAKEKAQALKQSQKKVEVWTKRLAEAQEAVKDAETRLGHAKKCLAEAEAMPD